MAWSLSLFRERSILLCSVITTDYSSHESHTALFPFLSQILCCYTETRSHRTQHSSFLPFVSLYRLALQPLATTFLPLPNTLHRKEPKRSTRGAAPCSRPWPSPESNSPISETSPLLPSLWYHHTLGSERHENWNSHVDECHNNIPWCFICASITKQTCLTRHHDVKYVTSSVLQRWFCTARQPAFSSSADET